jgi:MFS family permease
LKGVGFFLGGLLLTLLGFRLSLIAMAVGVFVALVGAALFFKVELGKPNKKAQFKQIFSKSGPVNVLSAARFFLFGARDVWFVVALPLFLAEQLNWDFWQVGAFLALWVIGYGIVQALAPVLMGRRAGKAETPREPDGRSAWLLAGVLAFCPAGIALALQAGFNPTVSVIVGLAAFGIVFALNSAIHSFLILAYTPPDEVALNVGFYYMANAGGRLLGTVLSGLIYLQSGLVGCLWVSLVFVLAAALLSLRLPLHPASPAPSLPRSS